MNSNFGKVNKVFVYGTLKKGFGNNRVLGDSKFLGTAVTVNPDFEVRDLGPFPFVTNGKHCVVGELYEVDNPDTERRLDTLEGYPSFYDRKVIEVLCGEERYEAWIYFIGSREGGYSLPVSAENTQKWR